MKREHYNQMYKHLIRKPRSALDFYDSPAGVDYVTGILQQDGTSKKEADKLNKLWKASLAKEKLMKGLGTVNNLDTPPERFRQKLKKVKKVTSKPSKPRPKPTYINGNVIDLHPYLDDEFWNIPSEINTETDDDLSKKKKEFETRLASYDPVLDPMVMAEEYWEDQWQRHEYKNRFKNAYDFMKWSLQNEDQQTFHKGGSVNKKKSGLATLAEKAVASDLLKKVISGKVALQFAPPKIQRKSELQGLRNILLT